MSWVKRPKFGAWGGLKPGAVRTRIRNQLPEIVQRDPRIQWEDITEYTLQSVIFEHASWCLGERWRVLVEDFIPNTKLKADLVIERLNADGSPDLTCGVIAVEVKPRGGIETLKKDIKKLKTYVQRRQNDVNLGLMIYLSSREVEPGAIAKAIGERFATKVYVRHLELESY